MTTHALSQADKATRFKSLHTPGTPLVLYNIWDAGSAKAIADAGAKALATGSWSVAAAQGYADGEALPLDLLLTIVARIAATNDLPLSVDFEGGYATDPAGVASNVSRLIAAGAIGINFEDRVINGDGLHSIEGQSARIAAARTAASSANVPLFINARTDLFLGSAPDSHAGFVDEAITRAQAYQQAGADGFFVPGLTQETLIRRITAATTLPVNVMMLGDQSPLSSVAAMGVARASFGPGAYRTAMGDLAERFRALTPDGKAP
ncbi:isocitrate lyase/phosphoenolpyruvate mutase family protein [Rhodobacteraceae bacterium D3-12]|nr:isocitrate lyase/phosphoenolpyruvate mutase family protein [Rhodobacteraceae bacterium D3-12]